MSLWGGGHTRSISVKMCGLACGRCWGYVCAGASYLVNENIGAFTPTNAISSRLMDAALTGICIITCRQWQWSEKM